MGRTRPFRAPENHRDEYIYAGVPRRAIPHAGHLGLRGGPTLAGRSSTLARIPRPPGSAHTIGHCVGLMKAVNAMLVLLTAVPQEDLWTRCVGAPAWLAVVAANPVLLMPGAALWGW